MKPSLLRSCCALLASGFLPTAQAARLTLRQDTAAHTISVYRDNVPEPILTQNARPDFRPYLHPIVAPDGKSVLTEFSPSHHLHQTGLYWGLTRVNGRDYFHNPGNGYWRRVASEPIITQGSEVKWSTVYHLLDDAGRAIMAETQVWTMRDSGDRYLLDLEWKGEGLIDLTVAKYDYGGLFVRMPWRAGMEGGVVNSNRQRDQRATGQRALWVDVGLKLEGRTDQAHIAVFDHPKNSGYPLPWRVDGQMGIGPSRAIAGDWSITRGQSETVRHQLVVYTGALNDLALTESWKAYTGQNNDTVLWGLAKAEGMKATFLTGEQAAAQMTVPAGFEVKLAAAEPMITQPMAFCWDDRGRMWVAENRDYETRKTGFANQGDSRIVILEDTDGDGKFDTRKVFAEGIPFPAAIAVGFDGLWLGAPPNLLFVPDKNHDDRADAAIEIRLTGWGIQDRHETLNSLNWGPDGWLYGCQGYATRSTVGKPADGGKLFKRGEAFPEKIPVIDGQYIDGGVWRYHPTKDRFEIVAHGFSNPWGLDFDDHGQMFITACVIPHLWHVIPGGIYHRQGGRHINPYIYDDIKTIADHRHRSAHGGARIYLADEFPREYRDRIFMANIHEHAVLTDILEPKGSGFVGHHGDDTLLANDAAWVGFSMEIGPDGAVYVLDWHDGDICGNSLTEKETGRIYRLAPKGLAGKSGLNLTVQSDLELVALLNHRNDWYGRRARVILQQRAAEGRLSPAVPPRLWELFAQSQTAAQKLRALWALHVTKQLPVDRLLPLLDHAEPTIRSWAIQLLGEDRSVGAEALKKFAAMAPADPSPVVRLALASVLQRIPLTERWTIAQGLVTHAGDSSDHNIPKLIWSGVEPLVPTDTARALALAAGSAIPQLTQWTVRRAVAAQQIEAVARTLTTTTTLAARLALLEGLRDGLTSLGRRKASAPENWSAASAALLATGDAAIGTLVTQVSQLLGDAKASAAQLAILRDQAAPVERRREILRSFARDVYVEALPATLALLDEAPLRRDAIRALAAFDDPRVAQQLLARYSAFTAADKAEAILTLAGRQTTARALFAALRQNTIPKRDVTAFAARQLQRVLGPAFVDFWGPVAQPAEDKQADIAKFKQLLTDAEFARANVPNGRALFERTCSTCHTLYGTGGNIGPDLTGSNRANLDYILTEIINPSEVMQESYQLVTVTTRDGRTLAGNAAAEDAQQLTLRLIGQDTVIAKSEILSREKSAISMMPEGLLKTLTTEEVRDLLAYLKTTQQVPLPKP
ncbi:PVC-type heme-binding CxxCH protein [Horticoccus sp. 23ND18S-11]|uniref:PVC-type heme-binding CxxCH protein n=1 Tax=Horticoccus sp. 23ND18S-11 TaxID=3391832 RepID=UPI0039C955DE